MLRFRGMEPDGISLGCQLHANADAKINKFVGIDKIYDSKLHFFI